MLTSTLFEVPPFFFTEMLFEETLILHASVPDSAPTPSPETSKHGVLSKVSEPLTTVVLRTEDVAGMVLLYGTFGSRKAIKLQ